jgi:GNAT superfamily N-acetyltransferase
MPAKSGTSLNIWGRHANDKNEDPKAASAAPNKVGTNTAGKNMDAIKADATAADKTPLTHADLEWRVRFVSDLTMGGSSKAKTTTAPKTTTTTASASASASTPAPSQAAATTEHVNPWMLPIGEIFKKENWVRPRDHDEAPQQTSVASRAAPPLPAPTSKSSPSSSSGTKQALLEVYLKDNGRSKLSAYANAPSTRRIGRFGFTIEAGPAIQELERALVHAYGGHRAYSVPMTAAALIYMYVEPEFRQRNLGTLALEVIQSLQSQAGCKYTVLVADDDGSGSLVDWYSQRGFIRAPGLQDVMGSPNAQFGTTMICKTDNMCLPEDCNIQWQK